jgi:hypothetical protein
MRPGKPTFPLQRMSTMRGFIWILLPIAALLFTAVTTYANDGHKEKEKDKDKGTEKCDDKSTSSNKPTPTINKISTAIKPSRVEEYVWMLNREPEVEDGDLENAVVDLYKWYLQNETRINNNDYLKGGGKSLVFPFKIDVKTLQQYFQFIKNNFPGLNEDDLDTNTKKILANRKKYAPVTERDDMENPMSIAVPK